MSTENLPEQGDSTTLPPLDSPVVDQWYAHLDARSAVGGRTGKTPESVLVAGDAAVAQINARRGKR